MFKHWAIKHGLPLPFSFNAMFSSASLDLSANYSDNSINSMVQFILNLLKFVTILWLNLS